MGQKSKPKKKSPKTRKSKKTPASPVSFASGPEESGSEDFFDQDFVRDYVPMAKRGRPKLEIATTEIEKIEVMASKGLTVDQMSAILGISKRTFERRAKEETKLSDAIARGRASATEIIAGHAYRMAQHNYKMTQFWLKTQAGWKEKSVLEVNDVDGALSGLTDEEKERRILKILNRLGHKSNE